MGFSINEIANSKAPEKYEYNLDLGTTQEVAQ